MTKKIYISSYEGDVLLTGLPNNYKREYAKNVAYHLLNEKHIETYGCVISNLSNLEYTVNPIVTNTYEECRNLEMNGFDNCVCKETIDVIASYDEILEWRK